MSLGGGEPCATHGPAAGCACCARGQPAAQSLDELEFARSACQAAAAGAADKLRRILDRAPDAVHSDGGKGTSGYTPLHYAARAGRTECAALLLARGAAADARTAQGHATPLHRAAHVGALPMVQLLVSHGADGALQDADGETPLHKAAAEGHAGVAAYLLQAFPAAAALCDRRGCTPAERAEGGPAAAVFSAVAATADAAATTAPDVATTAAAAAVPLTSGLPLPGQGGGASALAGM